MSTPVPPLPGHLHPRPAAPRFAPGQRVRVGADAPERRGPCHVRTPRYLRGRVGTVERCLGGFPDPGALAFGRPAPVLALYHVAFPRDALWPGEGAPPADAVLAELFEPWLEPA